MKSLSSYQIYDLQAENLYWFLQCQTPSAVGMRGKLSSCSHACRLHVSFVTMIVRAFSFQKCTCHLWRYHQVSLVSSQLANITRANASVLNNISSCTALVISGSGLNWLHSLCSTSLSRWPRLHCINLQIITHYSGQNFKGVKWLHYW